MINPTLTILIVISSIVVILTTIYFKKISFLEGLIVLISSNIILVFIWFLTLNIMVKSVYYKHELIHDIFLNIETINPSKDCTYNCITLYNHKWIVSTKDRDIVVHSKVSNLKNLILPPQIKKYKDNNVITSSINYVDIYNNLGQYKHSKYKLSNLNFNNITSKALKDITVQLTKLSANNNVDVIVVVSYDDTQTYNILDRSKGLRLNQILVHYILNEDNDVLDVSINTWGNNLGNLDFVRILKEQLYDMELNSEELVSTLKMYIPMYKLPNENSFNNYMSKVVPTLLMTISILLTSLILTSSILIFMYIHTQETTHV